MKYDVLIVGAGVTGALLFLALKNKNIKVGLIDGRDTAPNSYRHLSLNNKSMSFLKELDVGLISSQIDSINEILDGEQLEFFKSGRIYRKRFYVIR